MKNILITGASSGIGQEFAVQYASPDTRLFLTGRDADRLEAVARECRSKGSEVVAGCLDVVDRHAMADWIDGLVRDFGVDLVIANAGISGGFGGQNIDEILRDYKIFDVNLMGVLNTIYPVVPHMVARKSGQIVIISSLASFIPMPSAPAYSASKAAVRFYGEALAVKLKPHNIQVTVICPGFIKSRMTDVNDFPMPCLMETDMAVRHMIGGISRCKARIDFPLRLALVLKLVCILPNAFIRWLFAALPDKKSLPKD